MTFEALSQHLEAFLALKRARAKRSPYFEGDQRRRLRYEEALLRSFLELWRQHGCPWPIGASHAPLGDQLTAERTHRGSLQGCPSLWGMPGGDRMMDDPNGSQADTEMPSSTYCFGHVGGHLEGINRLGDQVCLNGAPLNTIVRVYVSYMQKNPKLMDENRSVGLFLAAMSSYPCSK